MLTSDLLKQNKQELDKQKRGFTNWINEIIKIKKVAIVKENTVVPYDLILVVM